MSINDWLMVAALVASLITRQWVAVALTATYCAQSAADYAGWLDAYGYYLSVAIIDAEFVVAISLMTVVNRRARLIQAVCLAFIPAQAIGLTMWYLYEPPLIYNLICSALYLALISSIIFGDRSRAGATKDSELRLVDSANRRRGVASIQANKGG